MSATAEATLAELVAVAASEVWRGNGEILANGIGTIPRLGASLAKLTHSPELLMTDSEAYLVEDPAPLGVDERPGYAGWMPFSRIFDVVWRGDRHAMVTPVQMDRWGQCNISVIGDYHKPKVQMLGARGLPGNSINHANSMFLPKHSKRAFVEGEVDMVSSVGFRAENWPEGVRRDLMSIPRVITDLCVMEFGGTDHALRVLSVHPGVTFEQVQEATSFPLERVSDLAETPMPTAEQLEIIRRLDPTDMRAGVIKGNPPARRSAAEVD